MKTRLYLCLVLSVAVLIAAAFYRRGQDAPRREALASLAQLDTAQYSKNHAHLLDLVVLPTAIQGRSAPEQSEFLTKALNDELPPEGLAELSKHVEHGPLKELFPAEAEAWAKQTGVKPDDRVAFRMKPSAALRGRARDTLISQVSTMIL